MGPGHVANSKAEDGPSGTGNGGGGGGEPMAAAGRFRLEGIVLHPTNPFLRASQALTADWCDSEVWLVVVVTKAAAGSSLQRPAAVGSGR